MYVDEDTGESAQCPYCDSKSTCPHDLGVIALTFYESFGLLTECWDTFVSELESVIHLAILNNTNEFKAVPGFTGLEEMYLGFVLSEAKDTAPENAEPSDLDVVTSDAMALFQELLIETPGVHVIEPMVDEDEGPMQASSYAIYYAHSPSKDQKHFDKLRKKFFSSIKKQITGGTV